LPRSSSDVSRVVAGDGPLFEANRRLVETLRMAERIRLLGAVSRDAIGALCRGCDLGVLPSVSEPFGIALLAIMACRKAVVASRAGDIPEIVRNGEEGLLVPAGDVAALAGALKAFLANPAKAARLGGRGRERIEAEFLAPHNSARYGELFASLLGGG
jgi:glycosyltransferase involved in cell wall biosynthesis